MTRSFRSSLESGNRGLIVRACSRRRCVSQRSRRLIHRLREQARSHIFKRSGNLQTQIYRPQPVY
ncbi:hypothetical protein C7A12_03430 [Pseudomonas fluorescens]|nr:hypothetical protein C7A12_03430 [Pseudomonas fluorescens]PRW81018.1 hypothetical protein C7A13_07305 [Pseudomonas fluorescens]